MVLRSDGRLEFVACWAHARRKVVESSTYQPEAEQLLGMIQALYDIEARGTAYSIARQNNCDVASRRRS